MADNEDIPKLGIVRNSKGQFEKGHSGNINAATHKNTQALKTFLSAFAVEKMSEIPTLWENLNSKDKLNMLFKIISINTPQDALGGNASEPITVTFIPADKKNTPNDAD